MILETLLPVLSTLGSATVLKPSRPERKKKNKQTNGKRQKINNQKTYHAYLYPVLPVFVYLLFFLCLWSVGWGNWKDDILERRRIPRVSKVQIDAITKGKYVSTQPIILS